MKINIGCGKSELGDFEGVVSSHFGYFCNFTNIVNKQTRHLDGYELASLEVTLIKL